jgi:hypothetical protein
MFNLQRKKEIAAGMYAYTQMVYEENAVFLFFEPQSVSRLRHEYLPVSCIRVTVVHWPCLLTD